MTSIVVMASTTVFGMADDSSGAPPLPGDGSVGFVQGLPYAEVFNSTSTLGIDPRLVAAVAWVETGGFSTDVIECRRASPDGALGIMQFMPATAAELGVDPCVPAEAIPGGARYLLEQHQEFGSWELALAAYNAGPQNVRDHGGIPPFAETIAYVPKVLDKWAEYESQFPGGSVGSGGTEAPFGPLGSTARYTQSRMTAKTQKFVDAVVPIFGQGRDMHCWRPGTEGEHPKGRACDFVMQLPLNQMPTPQYLEHGWALVNYCIEHADELQVRYVIWQKRIWQRGIGWRDYTRFDPHGNLQQNHYDHVHVTIEA